ncbi:hypothetical protein BpHYR1_011613 [Brachionus plicatilis]|uniref:Uncharacterized protein n=1 Tax=Brachionus plicatilis TaxID=10195 RepID=A0A3M7QXU5_BRAPC|nr:hypothetical protein BpHYR1_011613 [Brachionus plicatilis]
MTDAMTELTKTKIKNGRKTRIFERLPENFDMDGRIEEYGVKMLYYLAFPEVFCSTVCQTQ